MNDFIASMIQQAFIDANNMALIEEAYSTADFLEKCSRFIRYVNKKQTQVLVKDEINALKVYLELRKFHDTVECSIEIESQTAIIKHMTLLKIISVNLNNDRNNANIDNPTQIYIKEKTSESCIYVEIREPGEADTFEILSKTVKIDFM